MNKNVFFGPGLRLALAGPQAFALILGIICIVTFVNTVIDGQFLWDDEHFIQKNQYLTDWRLAPKLFVSNIVEGAGVSSNIYRPIQSLTHFFDVQLWGMNPIAHRATNLIVYVLAIVFLFYSVLRFLSQGKHAPLAAFFAVSLYAIHPLQTSAVGYVSGRGDLLMLLFGALSFLNFRSHFIWSVVFFIFCILSKESGLIFPALFLGYEWVQKNREVNWKIPWHRYYLMVFVMMSYVGLRLTVLNFGNFWNFYLSSNVLTENPIFRLFTYLSTLPQAFKIIVWPVGIHHERSWTVFASLFDWPVWFGALLLIAWLSTAFVLRKRASVVAIGMCWFLIATIPTSNLLILINALFYDHWFLVPGFGFCLVAASAFYRHSKSSLVRVSLVWLVLGACMIPFTLEQNQVWKDPVELFNHILKYEPASAKIMNNLAMEYESRGEVDRSEALYLKAIATEDVYAQTHHNLALVYFRKGHPAKALTHLNIALGMNPKLHDSYTWLGIVYLGEKQFRLSIQNFEKSIALHPTRNAYVGLVQAYLATGESEKAESYKRQALTLFP